MGCNDACRSSIRRLSVGKAVGSEAATSLAARTESIKQLDQESKAWDRSPHEISRPLSYSVPPGAMVGIVSPTLFTSVRVPSPTSRSAVDVPRHTYTPSPSRAHFSDVSPPVTLCALFS
eukprot:scaffold36278_cov134-Isochrysis_galbana.AAC.5